MVESDQQNGKPGKSTTNGWLEWVKEHPAIVGTALYVYLSFLGSTYYWMYLRRFDINFFDFAEANDFLTGAIRNPWILMVGLAGVGLFALFFKALAERPDLVPSIFRLSKRRQGEIPGHHGRSSPVVFFAILLLVTAYTFAPGFVLASKTARNTRDGWGSYIRLDLTSRVGPLRIRSDAALMLLGTSHKFIFLWDKSTDRTHVVPSASLASLSICRVKKDLWDFRWSGGPAPPCKP